MLISTPRRRHGFTVKLALYISITADPSTSNIVSQIANNQQIQPRINTHIPVTSDNSQQQQLRKC